MTDPSNLVEQAPIPERLPLRAVAHALAGWVLFGGTALAVCEAGFACGLAALLCGAAAMLFTRVFVNLFWSARLSRRAEPVRVPRWVVALYAAVGLWLLVLIMREAGSTSLAALEFLAGWTAGCWRLDDLWTRRARPEWPQASDAVRRWITARAAPHRLLLSRLGYGLSFGLLFGGVSLHAHRHGLSLAGVAPCGAACTEPGFLVLSAVLCGAGAVLLVMVYAVIAEALRYVLVDSWRHVRPGPPPLDLPVWVVALHIIVGLVVFFWIGAFVEISPPMETLGSSWMSVEWPDGKTLTLSGEAMLKMTLAWWIGGTYVLKFVWLRRRAAR
jgi:hypothetical protein